MKIQYLQNAAVIIENEGEKILCDPWLVDGCYYGSWYHYPKFDFKPEEFDDVNYIYISHIHPDHFDIRTLEILKKDIPVLIHEFPEKFLKRNIEKIGFKVIELPNNKRTKLDKTWINVLAADNCDPEICSRVFGCNFDNKNFGTNQIDTMSVIDNDNQVIVNTNDCPFEIGEFTARIVKESYKKIDLLMVGYTGASDYPITYDLDLETKASEANKKKIKRLKDAIDYIQIIDPKYYLPFAGRYVLGGKLSTLTKFKGESKLDEGYQYIKNSLKNNKNIGIILNSKSYFDIDDGEASTSYIPEDPGERKQYILDVLSLKKMDYEDDMKPELNEIISLISKSFERFERHRKQINYSTDTKIIIFLDSENLLVIPVIGQKYELVKSNSFVFPEKYLYVKMDLKLLKRILQGPQYAHWDNACIGCHISWKRVPNVYDMSLMYCLKFFHS